MPIKKNVGVLGLWLLSVVAYAQPDSVVVSGRIRNLSGRLYAQNPTVFISRNNILDASQEMVRPAPLQPDGSFRVSLPVIYPQEEMYLTYGRVSTPFLAAPGALSISMNADSLFTTDVPFGFSGVNAQVNNQFARYKAFEARYADKPDGKKLSEQTVALSAAQTMAIVGNAFQKPLQAFAAREKPFPLLQAWVGRIGTYNALGFLLDKLAAEDQTLPAFVADSLRISNDAVLSAARAMALNRFAASASQSLMQTQTKGLSVGKLADLFLRYHTKLTAAERARLGDIQQTQTAKAADLQFFESLLRRTNDTLMTVLKYEQLLARSQQTYSPAVASYIGAYWLASAMPTLTLDMTKLFYEYLKPQLAGEPRLRQSLDELYGLAVKDSVGIRAGQAVLAKSPLLANELEIASGVFLNYDRTNQTSGYTLLERVMNSNRGKWLYVLLTNPNEPNGRQAAQAAQQLRDRYGANAIAVIYVPINSQQSQVWPQLAIRNRWQGDHLLLSDEQLEDVAARLRSNDEISATLLDRKGKIIKRNAPLPAQADELNKLIQKSL